PGPGTILTACGGNGRKRRGWWCGQQGGDLRGEHLQAAGAHQRRDAGAVAPDAGGGPVGPGGAHPGQPPPGAVGDPTVQQPRRERGRSVPGGLHRPDEGHRQLRSLPDVRFSTYAVPMIIGEIRRYLRDNNPIRVSRSLRDVAYKALQVRDALVHRYAREPTVNQIAEELNLPREDVVFALDAIQEPISLFEPIYHDGGDPIYVMDQISDEKSEDGAWLEGISIREAMARLSEREQAILTKRFFQGRT